MDTDFKTLKISHEFRVLCGDTLCGLCEHQRRLTKFTRCNLFTTAASDHAKLRHDNDNKLLRLEKCIEAERR